MTRKLNEATLDQASRDYAARFLLPSVYSKKNPTVAIDGREWVLQSLYNADFKDEFERVKAGMFEYLGAKPRVEFEAEAKKRFAPREDKVFHELLRKKLAVDPGGDPIKGCCGSVVTGRAVAAIRRNKRGHIRPVMCDIHIGETAEQAVEKFISDLATNPNKRGMMPAELERKALNPTWSYEIIAAALDAAMDVFDEGTGAAITRIYDNTAAQPTDPDVAISTQVLLATLVMTDPAFGAAADQNPHALATASAIADDTSADATGTAAMYRIHATNDGATPLDDHHDGTVGTSGANLNMNTVAFVSGATVSITSFTIQLNQF